MPRLLFVVALLCSGLINAHGGEASKWQPGQVLSETQQDLGLWFVLVRRAIANPEGHWEGIGHFSFVYFRDKQLCQCTYGEFSVSPSGNYALVQDGPSGKMLLFSVRLGGLTEATKRYVGSPRSFTWDEQRRLVIVAFHQGLNNGYPNAEPISVVLP